MNVNIRILLEFCQYRIHRNRTLGLPVIGLLVRSSRPAILSINNHCLIFIKHKCNPCGSLHLPESKHFTVFAVYVIPKERVHGVISVM